jgi:glycosyltransferase involved in cell wall biosynthesis
MAESTGGIGRHVRLLASELPARGIAVSVCAPEASIAALGLDRLDVTVTAAPVGRASPRSVLRIRSALREAADGVDMVHAHGLRAAADAARFLRRLPLVTTWHNAAQGSAAQRMVFAALSRYVARRSVENLAASPDLEILARRRGAASARGVFIVAPVLAAATTDRAVARAALGVSGRPLVLAAGRLHTQKRFDVLVEAARAWADSASSPAVVIAGDGPLRAALAAQIRATGAPVQLLGARSDLADLLAAADLVALPSEWEARSLVAQEALRAGVPLVTTPVGGLPDLVGDAAAFVPVGDAAALRAAIEEVVASPAEHGRLAVAGRARAASWPSEGQAVDELVAIYLNLKSTIRR